MAQVLPNLAQEIAALKAQLDEAKAGQARAEAALQARNTAKVGMKVSEKGACSVYGLGRFPVTLYKSQWHTLAAVLPDVMAFIKANDSLLRSKE